MGLIGHMFAGAVQGGADFMADDIRAQIDTQRQQAADEVKQRLSQRIREENLNADHQRKLKEAPELAEAELTTNEKFQPRRQALENAKKDAELSWATENAGKAGAAKAAEKIGLINTPGYLDAVGREAAAGRDPAASKVLDIQLKTAELQYEQAVNAGKVPEAVKTLVAGMDADIREERKTRAELIRANDQEAVKAIDARIEEINKQRLAVLSPYLPKQEATGNDFDSKYPPKPKAPVAASDKKKVGPPVKSEPVTAEDVARNESARAARLRARQEKDAAVRAERAKKVREAERQAEAMRKVTGAK